MEPKRQKESLVGMEISCEIGFLIAMRQRYLPISVEESFNSLKKRGESIGWLLFVARISMMHPLSTLTCSCRIPKFQASCKP